MNLPSVAALRTLPPRTRAVMAANVISSVGTGLVQPFLVLYLTRVRGLPVGTATAVISVIALAALAGGPVAGRLADGLGLRRTAGAAMVTAALGTAGFALVSTAWEAVAAGLAHGFAYGAMLSVWHTVIARSTTGEARATAFGLQFVGLNAGVGIGGMLGGFFAHTAEPGRFQLLYVGDALSFLVAGALLVTALRGGAGREPREDAREPARQGSARGYRVVLRDRSLLAVLAFTLVLTTVGYGQLESSIPGLVAVRGLDARVMAWAFVANTCCIVLIQFAAVTRISRTAPHRLLVLTGVGWTVCWLLLLPAGTGTAGSAAGALVIGALMVFAVGESLLAVALPTVVNTLATAPLRGRYNGAYAGAMSAGLVIGPLLGGALLTAGHTWLLPATLAAGCAASAAAALLLGRTVRAARTPAHLAAPDEEVGPALDRPTPGDTAPHAAARTPAAAQHPADEPAPTPPATSGERPHDPARRPTPRRPPEGVR